MFSKWVVDKRERQRQDTEAKAKRKGAKQSPRSKNRRMMKIYGKSMEDMAASFHDRVDNWVQSVEQPETVLLGTLTTEYRPNRHKFRTRDAAAEFGAPFLSTTTSNVPRAAYRGGGLLNRAKSASCLPRRRAVNADKEATIPRIQQPPYENPKYPWRDRKKGREVGGPMRYAPRTENERIQKFINEHVVSGSSSGPHPVYGRPTGSPKGKGTASTGKQGGEYFHTNFMANDNRLRSVTGDKFHYLPHERYTGPPAASFRSRNTKKELGGTFHTTSAADKLVPNPHQYMTVGMGKSIDILEPPQERYYSQSIRLEYGATAHPQSITK